MPNPRGRPKQRELVVSPEQKIALRRLLQQPRSSRSLAFRARIILECVSGQNNATVADKLHTTGFTVGMWRNRLSPRAWLGWGTRCDQERRDRSAMTAWSGRYA
jgi:hypothetical protein